MAQARELAPNSRITVYVYNYAGVDESTLHRAQRVARYLFREAGVDAVLLDGPLSSEEQPVQEAGELGPSDFFLHILTREAAESLGLRKYALGLAPGTADELNRNVVYLFDHIAEKLAIEGGPVRPSRIVSSSDEKAQILAYGMAHEIGHLLLGSNSHGPFGIMRARWNKKDLCDIICGFLLFTPEESQRIRADVSRRNQEKSALRVSVPMSPQWAR